LCQLRLKIVTVNFPEKPFHPLKGLPKAFCCDPYMEKKKKKVDYEALNSALMRIPRMDVATARGLIDIGIHEIYQLQGRAPEVLLEEVRAKNPVISEDWIRLLRMAVYCAETENPEPHRLHPDQWS